MANIEIKQNPYYREVPYGGTDGQVLTKFGNTDEFMYGWTDATNDYATIKNKPSINGIELVGDTSLGDLGLQEKLVDGENIKTINNQSILGQGNIDLGKVDDVTVNGTSVLVDKIANIDLSNYLTLDKLQMGFSFITNVKVGNLEAGTQINATDTLGSILYNILYSDKPESILIYAGASNEIPHSLLDLDEYELERSELLSGAFEINIVAGDPVTEQSQYPCLAVQKQFKVNTWVAKGAESFLLPFDKIELEEYNIYYLSTKSYDEDLGGIDYVLNISEA